MTAGASPVVPSRGATQPTPEANGEDILERGPRRVILDAIAVGVVAGDALAGGPRGLGSELERAGRLRRNTLAWSLEKPRLRDAARPALAEMAELAGSIAEGVEAAHAVAALGGRDSAAREATTELWWSIYRFCESAREQTVTIAHVCDTLTRYFVVIWALDDLSPGLLIDPRFRVFYVLRGHERGRAGQGRLYSLLVERLVDVWRPRGRVRRELHEQARESGVSATDKKREVIHSTLAGIGGGLWRCETDLLLSGSRRAESQLERDARHRGRFGSASPLDEERARQSDSDENWASELETLSAESEARHKLAELMDLGSLSQRRIIQAMEAAAIDLGRLADATAPEESDASLIRKRAAESLGIAPATLRVQLARLRDKFREAGPGS